MTKSLKLFTIILQILFFVGCEKDNPEDAIPYWKFSDEDKKVLIKYNYQPNQIITYENQFGEKLHFKVLSNEIKKMETDLRGSFSNNGGGLINYYDIQTIRLEIVEFVALLDNCQDFTRVNYIFAKRAEEVDGGLYFPIWNDPRAFSGTDNEVYNEINIDLDEYNSIQRTQTIINTHLFTNVVIINSEFEYSGFLTCENSLKHNVKQIFYDYEFGIVQFNDEDGYIWKVIYPE